MSSRKRPYSDGDSYDIRSLFQFAREQGVSERCGPLSLERILFPKLLHSYWRTGGPLADPTRMLNSAAASGDWKQRSAGFLALPQRIEASAHLQRYMKLQWDRLSTAVAPLEDDTLAAQRAVTDIVFDMQEQFAIVCQHRRLATYSTENWHHSRGENGGRMHSPPVVVVGSQAWPGIGSRYSAVQFISSSLHIVTSYHRLPFLDIFDLEDVDEEMSEPLERFCLTGPHVNGGIRRGVVTTESESSYANDVVAVTENVGVAALSSGRAVWLDRRSGKVETCTGAFARNYSIGGNSTRVAGEGPLTAVAFLCRNDPINIVCGTETGAVQLWDVRCAREYVAVHMTSSAICSLQPSYTPPLQGVVWLNNKGGEVQGLSAGHSDMRLFAEANCADGMRSSETLHLPTPRLSLMGSVGLLACPHVSSNSLLLFDVGRLLKERQRLRSMGAVDDAVRCFDIGTDSSSDSSSSDSDDDAEDVQPLYRDSNRGLVPQAHASSEKKNGTSGEDEREVLELQYSRVLSCVGFTRIAATGVWSRYNRLLVGDDKGRVQLA
ncbi:hypothetical protein DQ04_07141030 [Trypanosoma grayi]|uniref:hypothetical protein n=1 Tax=Trypanosoma grayi TaxID=71804 RepID=UPI0004F49DE7|nr:hypothetical protein DQ04_07141030 [Trypanosoma grayi]KEG08460.1 hypothetical protein DQ04_07141030 [Trypanosoma grayi]